MGKNPETNMIFFLLSSEDRFHLNNHLVLELFLSVDIFLMNHFFQIKNKIAIKKGPTLRFQQIYFNEILDIGIVRNI